MHLCMCGAYMFSQNATLHEKKRTENIINCYIKWPPPRSLQQTMEANSDSLLEFKSADFVVAAFVNVYSR